MYRCESKIPVDERDERNLSEVLLWKIIRYWRASHDETCGAFFKISSVAPDKTEEIALHEKRWLLIVDKCSKNQQSHAIPIDISRLIPRYQGISGQHTDIRMIWQVLPLNTE